MKTLGLLALAAAGCGDLNNFGGTAPPLATITITATGDFDAVHRPDTGEASLHVAVVWGEQSLPEPMCFLPPESPEVAAVLALGCRNPLSFSPARVTDVAPIVPNEPVSLSLTDLPAADLMVGTVEARVGYASFVIFDDLDRDGVLQLLRPQRFFGGDVIDPDAPPPPPPEAPVSVVYGASFVAMTEPDTRLAFREGDFFESGFYPRHGCGEPPPAFSLLSAGGFSFEEAIDATLAGRLPSQDPATCVEESAEDATLAIPFRPMSEVGEVACAQRRDDSSVRYREPRAEMPDFQDRAYACASIPNIGGDPVAPPGTVQLIVSSRPDAPCKSLTHFTLMGCPEDETLVCDAYEWDYRANPPAWWPCPVTR